MSHFFYVSKPLKSSLLYFFKFYHCSFLHPLSLFFFLSVNIPAVHIWLITDTCICHSEKSFCITELIYLLIKYSVYVVYSPPRIFLNLRPTILRIWIQTVKIVIPSPNLQITCYSHQWTCSNDQWTISNHKNFPYPFCVSDTNFYLIYLITFT